jgi:hypothetical protein
MGWQLCMSGELRDWLAALGEREPGTARQVGEALAALAAEGPGLGPPLVTAVGWPLEPDLADALDRVYQTRLEQLSALRRQVAEAATQVKRAELLTGQLESLQAQLAGQRGTALAAGDQAQADRLAGWSETVAAQLAMLRRLTPGRQAAERTLNARMQRRQLRVEAFRSRKEAFKARYTSARAMAMAAEALAGEESTRAGGDPSGAAGPPGEAARLAAQAAEQLREITGQIRRELAAVVPPDGGLLDLRPGAPGDSGIRILFTGRPPDTAWLLAVLEGPEAIRDQYAEAVAAAAALVARDRDGDGSSVDPAAADEGATEEDAMDQDAMEELNVAEAGAGEAVGEYCYDLRSFLAEFFPGDAAAVEAAAISLAAASRGGALARRRSQLGLTQAEVAARMGATPAEVAVIERAGLAESDLGLVGRYVAALGGHLEVTADFGGDRTVLG